MTLLARDQAVCWAIAIAAVVGLGISIYLTGVHYAGTPLACSGSGLVNCEAVISSSYGTIGPNGVPTSAAGIGWFAISLVLSLVQIARPQGRFAPVLHQYWSGAGLAVALLLVSVDVVRIGAICAWCSAAHALVLLTLLLVLYRNSLGHWEQVR